MPKNSKRPDHEQHVAANVADQPQALDHGVQSLVAKDNPDDVDTALAVRAQKRGSRR